MGIDLAIEGKIIKSFFYENKQERLQFEMSRRGSDEIVSKLSHTFANYIRESCVVGMRTKGRTDRAILDAMRANGVLKNCYVLCGQEDLTRSTCDLAMAVERLNTESRALLIVGLPSGFTFFQAETLASYKPNCFLKPEKRFDGIKWING